MAKIIVIIVSLTISFTAMAQENNPATTSKSVSIDSLKGEDTTIYEIVDSIAHFPGSKQEWYKYIGKTLNPSVGVDNGAKTGTYRVKIRLTVLKDGTLQDFKPESKYGHGFEEEVIRSLKLSPKWVPAMRNGVPVNSTLIHTQIFSITSGR
jgi:hypothetical protein